MYTVHTTGPRSFARDAGIEGVKRGDCFYGWGESRIDKDICPKHVTFDAPSLEAADALASMLALEGHQVVVTDLEDWSIVVTGATTPMYYLAAHEH